MTSSEVKNNGVGNNETGVPTFPKQPPITAKKVVLTDVQNDNRSFVRKHQESSLPVEGKPIADSIKFSGTKRLTPECPSSPSSPSSHPFPPPLSNTATKEHLTYTRKKFEFEPEKGRVQNNTNKYPGNDQLTRFRNLQQEIARKQTQIRESNVNSAPLVVPNHMAPKMTFSYPTPSVPSSLGKPGNGVRAAEFDCLKVTSEVRPNSRRADGQNWEERYIRLQNFLKKCDESSNLGDHIERLRRLSPAELSVYAVELEKKTIHLTIEEGKEIQRMKALNILGKSAATVKPLDKSQPPPPPVHEMKINEGIR